MEIERKKTLLNSAVYSAALISLPVSVHNFSRREKLKLFNCYTFLLLLSLLLLVMVPLTLLLILFLYYCCFIFQFFLWVLKKKKVKMKFNIDYLCIIFFFFLSTESTKIFNHKVRRYSGQEEEGRSKGKGDGVQSLTMFAQWYNPFSLQIFFFSFFLAICKFCWWFVYDVFSIILKEQTKKKNFLFQFFFFFFFFKRTANMSPTKKLEVFVVSFLLSLPFFRMIQGKYAQKNFLFYYLQYSIKNVLIRLNVTKKKKKVTVKSD